MRILIEVPYVPQQSDMTLGHVLKMLPKFIFLTLHPVPTHIFIVQIF